MFGNEVLIYAARARKERDERARVIADLGWEPEDPTDRYAASTAELVCWLREMKVEEQ